VGELLIANLARSSADINFRWLLSEISLED